MNEDVCFGNLSFVYLRNMFLLFMLTFLSFGAEKRDVVQRKSVEGEEDEMEKRLTHSFMQKLVFGLEDKRSKKSTTTTVKKQK